MQVCILLLRLIASETCPAIVGTSWAVLDSLHQLLHVNRLTTGAESAAYNSMHGYNLSIDHDDLRTTNTGFRRSAEVHVLTWQCCKTG